MKPLVMLLLALVCVGVGYVVSIGYKCWRLMAAGRKLRRSREGRQDSGEARPDRRGMGSQSDFISETFVPSEGYRARQVSMARTLIAAGSDPVQVAALFTIPVDLVNPKL